MISTKSFGIITLKKLYFGEVETPYCEITPIYELEGFLWEDITSSEPFS